jgi:hypothetical protein
VLRFPDHQNIVSIYGVIPDQMAIIMEVAESSLAKVSKMILYFTMLIFMSNYLHTFAKDNKIFPMRPKNPIGKVLYTKVLLLLQCLKIIVVVAFFILT